MDEPVDPNQMFSRFPDMVASVLGEDVGRLEQLRTANFPRIFAALTATDSLSAILRLHLHIEQALSELLSKATPYSLDVERWSMPRRLDLAAALGLIHPDERTALLAAAGLRNKLAHRLNYELTADDAARFIASMHPDVRRALGVMQKGMATDWNPDAAVRFGLFVLLTTLMARMDFYGDVIAQGRTFRQAVDEAPPISEGDFRATLDQVIALFTSVTEATKPVRDSASPDNIQSPRDVGTGLQASGAMLRADPGDADIEG